MSAILRLIAAIEDNPTHPDRPAIQILWSALSANSVLSREQNDLAADWLADQLEA